MSAYGVMRSVLFSLASFAATAPADATLVRFDYSGTIRHIAFFGTFTDTLGYSTGEAVAGSFVVDLSVSDTDASPSRSFRALSVTELSFGHLSTNAATADYSYFLVDADPQRDNIQAYAQTALANVIDTFEFSLESPLPTAVLGNDSPDFSALQLADFDLSDSRFSFLRVEYPIGETLQGVQLSAKFDSLSATVLSVP